MGTIGDGIAWVDWITEDDAAVANSQIQAVSAASIAYAQQAQANAMALIEGIEWSNQAWSPVAWVPIDDGGLSGITADEPIAPTPDAIDVRDVIFEGTIPPREPPIIGSDPPPDPSYGPPDINIPAPPPDEFPIFSTDPPSINDPAVPEPPPVVIPPLPLLPEINIPSPPEYNIPDFDGVPPTTDLTPPEPVFSWNEAQYDSDVLSALETKILDMVVNGTTGLNQAWESAFLERMKNELLLQEEQEMLTAQNQWAERGFTMPPGALAGQMIELQHKVLRNRENLLNDIIIKQEDAAFEFSKYIIGQAITLENYVMQNLNQFQNRVFEAAKFNVESALIIYQARVEAYKAELEAYRVLAQVYESKIKVEVAKAELYKAVIDGIEAQVEVNKSLVDAYEAQIKGIAAVVDLYTAQMQGAKVKAEVDATRVAAYRSLVEAYAARVNAITAKYEAYKAQIAGEESKARVYAAEVDGYRSEVEAYKAKADVDVSRAEAQLKIVDADVRIFSGYVEKYKADVEHAVREAAAQVEIEKLDVTVYEAKVRNYEGELRALAEAFRGKVEDVKSKYLLSMKQGEVFADYYAAQNQLLGDQARAAAQVEAALGAAALAQVSVSTATSHRTSQSDTAQNSAHEQTSNFWHKNTQNMDILNRFYDAGGG